MKRCIWSTTVLTKRFGEFSAEEMSHKSVYAWLRWSAKGDKIAERRAVTLYISSLMKAKDSEQKTPPKP